MGRAYALELQRLKRTVEFASDADVRPLATLLADLVPRNLIFVGSGGSFTAATFAAALHEQYTGQLTKAVTPLEAATRAPTTNTASVLISARGSNPDIMRAFQALRFKEPIAAICASERNALLRSIDESGAGVGYGFTVPGGKDGFLATNSLLATLILLVRSYDSIFGMPELDLRGIGALSGTSQDGLQPNSNLLELAGADTIIALSSGWGWPAAIDLESKCSESGLSNVLLSDFRNFAHGRHNWLRRRAESTAVVSIEDATNTGLASTILQLVPDDVCKFRLFSEGEGPGAGIDLISQVLHLVGSLGAIRGLDPGRPPIATFGRTMYRNGFKAPLPPTARQTWIARKAEALGLLAHEDTAFVAEGLDCFLDRLRHASIRAVVADYDGTLCAPSERFTGMSESMARSLSTLLADGLFLGIATGRGGSAFDDLRRVIPAAYWDNVLLGLYNGAVMLHLSDTFLDQDSDCNPQHDATYEALQSLIDRLPVRVLRNTHQLSLVPTTPLNLDNLRRSVIESLDNVIPPSYVHQSAHSVDILHARNSKVQTIQEVQRLWGIADYEVLRIGDLGNWGGNDFDLLNQGLSLSVDRVSSKLDSCWNLGPPGTKGIATTMQYLRALYPVDGAFELRVDSSDLLAEKGKR